MNPNDETILHQEDVAEEQTDLMPVIPRKDAPVPAPQTHPGNNGVVSVPDDAHPIAIKRVKQVPAPYVLKLPAVRQKTSMVPVYMGAIATVVVVLTLGAASLKSNSVYTVNILKKTGGSTLAAAAADAAQTLGDYLEKILTRDLTYVRAQQ